MTNKKVEKRIKICKKILRKEGLSKDDIAHGGWSIYKNIVFRKSWIVLYYIPNVKVAYLIKGYGNTAFIEKTF